MNRLLEFFRGLPIPWSDLLWDYGPPFLLGALIAWLAQRAARARLARRDFLHRVNFSLNYIEDNVLRIRTLNESDVDQIILGNRHARNMLLRAARRARDSDQGPFLDLPAGCSWLVLNAILNELAELLPTGPVARSMGLPVRATWYVFGATCEWDDDVNTRKIRVMIIAEELLKRIDQYPTLRFEHPWHQVRYQTLLRMRELFYEDRRAEAAEEDRRRKREVQRASLPEKQRQRAVAKDRQADGRALPVRNLMRIELALPVQSTSAPVAGFAIEE